MNKGDKLVQEMQRGQIDANEAINKSLEYVAKEHGTESIEVLVNALFYAMISSEKVYAAIHVDGPLSVDNLIETTEIAKDETKRFFLQTVNMPNGYKVAIVYTGRDKLQLVPNIRYLEIGLEELFVYIVDLDINGFMLNPGPENAFIPMEVVKGLINQWAEYCEQQEKENKKKI